MRSVDRLRDRREFQRVYSEGVKVVGRLIVVFAQPGVGAVSRLGVTATRRTGNAVVRNRSRRRLRALFRGHRDQLGERPLDIVVNVRTGCAEAPWADLERDFRECLSKIARRLSRPGS
jgi:ribonuclease P protein component